MAHLVLHDFSSSDLLRRTHTPKTNMKSFIVFAALVAVALAAVPHRRQAPPNYSQNQVVLVKETPHNNIGLDGYGYKYELSDGQKREESAQVQHGRTAEEPSVLRVQGSFSYVDPVTGETYAITYIADENGFQPQGAHLPVA